MRTPDHSQEELLYAVSIETLIPGDHPLRAIRKHCDQALARMQPLFSAMYSHTRDTQRSRRSVCCARCCCRCCTAIAASGG